MTHYLILKLNQKNASFLDDYNDLSVFRQCENNIICTSLRIGSYDKETIDSSIAEFVKRLNNEFTSARILNVRNIQWRTYDNIEEIEYILVLKDN